MNLSNIYIDELWIGGAQWDFSYLSFAVRNPACLRIRRRILSHSRKRESRYWCSCRTMKCSVGIRNDISGAAFVNHDICIWWGIEFYKSQVLSVPSARKQRFFVNKFLSSKPAEGRTYTTTSPPASSNPQSRHTQCLLSSGWDRLYARRSPFLKDLKQLSRPAALDRQLNQLKG